jgi:hypothetical protein
MRQAEAASEAAVEAVGTGLVEAGGGSFSVNSLGASVQAAVLTEVVRGRRGRAAEVGNFSRTL